MQDIMIFSGLSAIWFLVGCGYMRLRFIRQYGF